MRILIATSFLIWLPQLFAVAKVQSIQDRSLPWLRIDQGVSNLRINRQGTLLAFTTATGRDLNVLKISSKEIKKISSHLVGASFFFSPDGIRIFYRELHFTDNTKEIHSNLNVFEVTQNKSIPLDQFPHATGFLTFDPRDMKMHLMYAGGIHSRKLNLPDQKIAKWQTTLRSQHATMVATQKAIVRISKMSKNLEKLQDDDSGIEAFELSPDGSRIVWSTKEGRVYMSDEQEHPLFIGFGRDPSWHPNKMEILYAGARTIGKHPTSLDIRIAKIDGSGYFLTNTPSYDERWPVWDTHAKRIIHTRNNSTDIFQIEHKK